jgi:uncharacterized membrane protein YgcG
MKCPSCAYVLAAPADRCSQCKFSLSRMDMKFGLVPAHSRFLTDRSGKLPLEEMEQLRAALRLFQKKFPQTLFSILLVELSPETPVAEYAFWLANRAKFGSVEKKLGDNFNLLLVIDLMTNSAALTIGYGLEPYVHESDLQQVLDALAAGVRERDLATGLRACIESLTQRLRELSAKAKSAPLAVAVPA